MTWNIRTRQLVFSGQGDVVVADLTRHDSLSENWRVSIIIEKRDIGD
jgi:hypothetical protein